MLLKLPAELRIYIYVTVIVSCPCHTSSASHTHRHETAENMLLVNRQIYNEARAIIFGSHSYQFRGWQGNGVHLGNVLLQRLQAWQRRAVRILSIWAVESCFVNFSSGNHPTNNAWINICSMLRTEAALCEGGLQELSLVIGGALMRGSELVSPNADWIKRGLRYLPSLRRLYMIFTDCVVEQRFAARLKSTLSGVLPKTTVTIGGTVRGRAICLS